LAAGFPGRSGGLKTDSHFHPKMPISRPEVGADEPLANPVRSGTVSAKSEGRQGFYRANAVTGDSHFVDENPI
jgi:hypothetical protein